MLGCSRDRCPIPLDTRCTTGAATAQIEDARREADARAARARRAAEDRRRRKHIDDLKKVFDEIDREGAEGTDDGELDAEARRRTLFLLLLRNT